MKAPMDARMPIAVIGAGPSGLYAAEALRCAGYRNVTVLEKRARVGGMALSRVYESESGKRMVYEMGSAQPFGSKKLFALIEELGLHLGIERGNGGKPGRFRFFAQGSGRYIADHHLHHANGHPLARQWDLLCDVAKILPWLLRFRRLMRPGHAHGFSRALRSMTEAEWFARMKFRVIEPILRSLFSATASGGAAETPEQPRLLLQSMKSLVFAFNPPLRYTAGLMQPVREGYQEVLKRLARRHHVITRADITAITRASDGVRIRFNDTEHRFERLVIACPPAGLFGVLDASAAEQAVFGTIRNRPTWRVAFLARGIRHAEAAYVVTDAENGLCGFSSHGTLEGEGDAALHLYCGLVGHDRLEGIETVLQDAARMLTSHFGAYDIQWIDKAFWPEFNSHFAREAVAGDVYEIVEAMQGQNRTYYTGEYLAGNSHSMTLEYSWQMVKRHM